MLKNYIFSATDAEKEEIFEVVIIATSEERAFNDARWNLETQLGKGFVLVSTKEKDLTEAELKAFLLKKAGYVPQDVKTLSEAPEKLTVYRHGEWDAYLESVNWGAEPEDVQTLEDLEKFAEEKDGMEAVEIDGKKFLLVFAY